MTALLVLALMGQVNTPVGFLAHPHVSGFKVSSFSEQNGPFEHRPGQHLIIREPDGTERVVATGVQDWCVSLDGQSIYYAQVHTAGKFCDIYRVPVAGGEPVKLTDAASEWRPPTGVYPMGSDGPVWNTAPCDTPEGIFFTSSRDNIKSPGEGYTAFMLYRMAHDGSNVEKIGHMNLGGALHPTYFKGRVYFASGEQQGLRGSLGSGWAIWSMKPDGTDWQPEITAANPIIASRGWHRTAHASDGTLLAERYYDTRQAGKIEAIPPLEPGPFAEPKFGKPVSTQNPYVWDGWDELSGRVRSGNFRRYAFQRTGVYNPLPWAQEDDRANNDGRDPPNHQGEVGFPAGLPGGDVLCSWTGSNAAGRDWGIYRFSLVKHYPPPDTRPVTGLSDRPLDYLVKVVDEPDRHEWDGKPIASYQDIYGSPPPAMTPSPIATELPDGTPYAIFGSSNIHWNEILAPDGKSLIKIEPADVAGVRVLHFNPTQDVGRRLGFPEVSNGGRKNREGFHSAINERMSFYEPLIPVEDDGSIAAAIVSNQPWSVALIDHEGRTLGFAQTWHQLCPREKRVDCNGCHAHNVPAPENFYDQKAGQPGYNFVKLTQVRTLIYERDIKPIDERLSLGIGPRPWDGNAAWRAFRSKDNPVLNDARLTDAERRTLAAWQDTGMLAYAGAEIGSGHGPEADTVPPTLVLTPYTDKTLIGAADPQSGINWDSLSVIHNGNDIASLFVREGDVLTGPPVDGTVTVSIRDKQAATGAEQGNLTSITRRVTPITPPIEPPPPNPNQPRIDEIHARLAEIADEIEGLEAERAALLEELKDLE